MRTWLVAALLTLGVASPAQAAGGYSQAVTGTPGLLAYWRMDDPGGAHGALSGDPDTATRFDGVDDEFQASTADAATLEGWFFWESGVALMRDNTSSGGWILAFDSGGQVAYRAGGATVTTTLATSELRDGWHYVALTLQGSTSAFYVDGKLVSTGSGGGAPAMPWHVMRNGVTSQFTRGRADEVALYSGALDAATIQAHFLAGRDVTDTTPPAAPAGLKATPRLGRIDLDWSDSAGVDGYDVFRATSAAGPFTRVNPSRLETSSYTAAADASYVYIVTASDVANNRSAGSAPVTAAPLTTTDLLRRYAPELRYETQESYFADSAAEITDNARNSLFDANGARIAAPPQLSLSFLGSPLYANGRTAADGDYIDEANTYQADAQRLRAAGYADRVYGRVATAGGRTFLQYWFFYYYNPQNVLGIGVHEGDWEFAQLALDADGDPATATYAHHGDGERCTWSQVQRTAAGVPVVFVALASHASYFTSGVTSRGFPLPADNHRGDGYRVRPQIEVVTPSTPFMAWRGRWGGSSSSPVAPRRQGSWTDPAGFEATAAACTGTASAAGRTSSPEPRIRARRVGGRVIVWYRVPQRAKVLLVSVARAGAPDVTTARRIALRRRTSSVRLRALPGPLVVQASTFSRRGVRSGVARADLR